MAQNYNDTEDEGISFTVPAAPPAAPAPAAVVVQQQANSNGDDEGEDEDEPCEAASSPPKLSSGDQAGKDLHPPPSASRLQDLMDDEEDLPNPPRAPRLRNAELSPLSSPSPQHRTFLPKSKPSPSSPHSPGPTRSDKVVPAYKSLYPPIERPGTPAYGIAHQATERPGTPAYSSPCPAIKPPRTPRLRSLSRMSRDDLTSSVSPTNTESAKRKRKREPSLQMDNPKHGTTTYGPVPTERGELLPLLKREEVYENFGIDSTKRRRQASGSLNGTYLRYSIDELRKLNERSANDALRRDLKFKEFDIIRRRLEKEEQENRQKHRILAIATEGNPSTWMTETWGGRVPGEGGTGYSYIRNSKREVEKAERFERSKQEIDHEFPHQEIDTESSEDVSDCCIIFHEFTEKYRALDYHAEIDDFIEAFPALGDFLKRPEWDDPILDYWYEGEEAERRRLSLFNVRGEDPPEPGPYGLFVLKFCLDAKLRDVKSVLSIRPLHKLT